MDRTCTTCGNLAILDKNVGYAETIMHSKTVKLLRWKDRLRSSEFHSISDVSRSNYCLEPGVTCVNCALNASVDAVRLDDDNSEFSDYLRADGYGDKICFLDTECTDL